MNKVIAKIIKLQNCVKISCLIELRNVFDANTIRLLIMNFSYTIFNFFNIISNPHWYTFSDKIVTFF